MQVAEKRAQSAEEKLKLLEEKTNTETVSTKELEEAKAEAERAKSEITKLRRELAMSNEAVTLFKTYFELWQKAYDGMSIALGRADEQAAGRMQKAMNSQITAWAEANGGTP